MYFSRVLNTNGSLSSLFIEHTSVLAKLFALIQDKDVEETATILEGSQDLEEAYKVVALKGDTSPPEDPEEEVDYHYLCFVKSNDEARLVELDGDRNGPVDRGPIAHGTDLMAEEALAVMRTYILEGGENVGFNLMALATTGEQ